MEIQPFLTYLKNERRYSPHTLLGYRKDLHQFVDYLRAEHAWQTGQPVDSLEVRGWVVSLMKQGLAATTVKRKLSAVKSYYAFAKKRGWAAQNPAAHVPGPETTSRLPSFVREEQMELLLCASAFGNGFQDQRDRLVLELLYGLGLRRAEIVQITDTDVDHGNGTLRIYGKGNKVRLLPLSPALCALIVQYQTVRNETFDGAAKATLILSNTGKKAYGMLIYRIVRHHLAGVTTLSSRSPHLLRHTFATHLSNHGAPLNAIKELLGHSSLAATQMYMHNSIERLQSVYKQAHPSSEEE